MDRARRQGKNIGRPMVTVKRGCLTRYKTVLERLSGGELARGKTAKELGIGYTTIKRLIDNGYPYNPEACDQ